MGKQKPTPLTGDFDFMDLFSTADKSLDQVKKYLEAQKEELQKLKEQGNLEDLAANIKRVATEGFREDLKENGVITEVEQEPYLTEFNRLWEEMQMSKKAEAILSSPEFSAMDQFARRAENLPKLKELIETAKPQAKWQMMLSGILASFPALQQYFGDDINKLLGNLGVITKQEEGEENDAEKPGETTEKDEGEKDGEQKEERETAATPNDGPLDGPEGVPESWKPEKTLILGDSHYDRFIDGLAARAPLREKMNASGAIVKGGQTSNWLLQPGSPGNIENRPDSFFREYENVVIGFGSNDMGTKDVAITIWQRLNRIIGILRQKNPKIKIIMATVPPAKGNGSGEWLSNFDGVEKKRKDLNDLIRMAKRNGKIQGVMDLAAKKDEGGLAKNSDESTLDESFRRPGDKVHARAKFITTAIRRALYHARDIEVNPQV